MSTQTPTIGRIVQYRLSDQDAEAINRRRKDAQLNRRNIIINGGEQVHVGNNVQAGDVFPMLITRVWDVDHAESVLVNGQVLLDGNDTYWATSVGEGAGERQYQWPNVTSFHTGGYTGTSGIPLASVDTGYTVHTAKLSAADRELLKEFSREVTGGAFHVSVKESA